MLIHSAVITGSVQFNNTDVSSITNVAGFATTSSVDSLVVKTGSYATTGSNQFNGNQSVSGSITSNGTITAQTLVVQTVTSSVDFITGSARFGSLLTNTHQFTGSVGITGSLAINGTGVIVGSGTTNYLPKFTGASTIGNSSIQDLTTGVLVSPTVTASSAIARGIYQTPTLVASANNDVLVGLDINPTFTNGAFTGVTNYGIRYNSSNAITPFYFQSTLNGTAYTTNLIGGNNTFTIASRDLLTTTFILLNGSNGVNFYSYSNKLTLDRIGTNSFFTIVNQNVAIGTTTDSGFRLDVNGTARVSGAATFSSSGTFSGLVTAQTTSAATITQNFLAYNSGTSVSGASYDFQSGGTSQTARISANYEASSPDRMSMKFSVGQGSGLVKILELYNSSMIVTGNVEINNANGLKVFTEGNGSYWLIRAYNAASNQLRFNYQGSDLAGIATGTGNYTALSDVNKKKDFEQSQIGLNEVLGLKPTLYRMKTEDGSQDKHLGFIAQEVKEFIPQAYSESGEGDDKFIGLTEMPIIAALVKAIQEQQSQIEELKTLLKA